MLPTNAAPLTLTARINLALWHTTLHMLSIEWLDAEHAALVCTDGTDIHAFSVFTADLCDIHTLSQKMCDTYTLAALEVGAERENGASGTAITLDGQIQLFSPAVLDD